MASRRAIDLLIIGADAAGLAAAACAARLGAKTALVATGGEPPEEGFAAEPPNFVWRLLDLHQYELKFEDSDERVSLFGDNGRTLSTTGDPARAGTALAGREAALGELYPAFVADMKRRAASPDAGPAGDRYLSANALLDDYFADEDLKAHLLAAHVAPFGLAGDEAGSAEALATLAAFPRRRGPARALADALRKSAEEAGVEFASGRLQSLRRGEGKMLRAQSEDGGELRLRRAMASSAVVGEAAGLLVTCGASALLRRLGAEAVIRIRYDKRPKAPVANGALFFTAADRKAFLRARTNMIEGVIDEEPPLSFEIIGKEIVARAPFCPARLRAGGEERDWTGQDRQVLARNAASLIERRLGGDVGSVREVEVTIGPDIATGLRRRSFAGPSLPAPAPSPDPIGAAAALAMELVRRD